MAAEHDDRWTDLRALLIAGREAGVELFACPIWSRILDVRDSLPPEVSILDSVEEMESLMSERRVIGGF